jgi:hypothetical protein
MMAFDEAKFREAALKAGYSEAEINAELKGPAPAGAVAPQAIASGPETAAKFDAEGAAKRAEIVQGFEESSKRDASQSPMTIPGVLTSPVALVAGGTVLGALATYAAPKISKGIKERYMTKAPDLDRTIDIPTGGFFDIAPDATLNPLGQPTAETINKVQKAERLAEANRQLGIGGNQPVPPVVPPQFPPEAAFAGTGVPPSPPYLPSTPFSAAPPGAPAPESSAGPNSSTTSIVNNTVKEMIDEVDNSPQELRTGTGKPAFAGMAPPPKVREKGGMAGKPIFKNTYAKPEDIPAGYAFVPNAQFIDPGRQDMGQPLFTKTYSAQDYALTDKMAREQASEINRMLGKPTRAELKAAGLELAPNTPGITQYINQPKGSGMGTKTVKVGGVLGALIAIPDLAKAETPGQRGMAGANLLEAVLPPGFMMGGAGEGSSAVPGMSQAMLLGSPYAQSDIAKRLRQEQEYTRKVGAGRGIAPPSAYLR